MKRAFGVYVGRFQPPHHAHVAVMLEALDWVETLVIVLGSARAARTPKNPFTEVERRTMLVEALREVGVPLERLMFAHVRDLYGMDAWANAVRAAVARSTGGARDIVLVGHDKDASTTYLNVFPEWSFIPTTVRSGLSATDVREAWFRGDTATLAGLVPPAVMRFLTRVTRTPEFAELRGDHTFLAEWHDAWRASPAPATLVAVHAVVTNERGVLLTRRTARPGRGLLALPGGHLLPGLDAWTSLVRLVLEQTGICLPDDPPGAPVVFDHPGRSLLGREVAVVYRVSSEPGGAHWWALTDALGSPERFYGDHHRILEVVSAQHRAP